jgi:hypothetical protein
MRRKHGQDKLVDALISQVETIDLTADAPGCSTVSDNRPVPQNPVSTTSSTISTTASKSTTSPASETPPLSSSSQNGVPGPQQPVNKDQASSTSSYPPAKPPPPSASAVAAAASVPLDDSEAAKAPPADLLLPGGFKLAGTVASKLYTHQVVGVQWLWSLHTSRKGGILADDMGLGKTMQCAAFLAAVLRGGLAKRALIVAPKTLLDHWEKELRGCGLRGQVHSFYSTSVVERNHALAAVTKRGGVLLTTYGMVLHNSDSLKLDCAEELQGECEGLGHQQGSQPSQCSLYMS